MTVNIHLTDYNLFTKVQWFEEGVQFPSTLTNIITSGMKRPQIVCMTANQLLLCHLYFFMY